MSETLEQQVRADRVFLLILIELICDFVDLCGRRPTAEEIRAQLSKEGNP